MLPFLLMNILMMSQQKMKNSLFAANVSRAVLMIGLDYILSIKLAVFAAKRKNVYCWMCMKLLMKTLGLKILHGSVEVAFQHDGRGLNITRPKWGSAEHTYKINLNKV